MRISEIDALHGPTPFPPHHFLPLEPRAVCWSSPCWPFRSLLRDRLKVAVNRSESKPCTILIPRDLTPLMTYNTSDFTAQFSKILSGAYLPLLNHATRVVRAATTSSSLGQGFDCRDATASIDLSPRMESDFDGYLWVGTNGNMQVSVQT